MSKMLFNLCLLSAATVFAFCIVSAQPAMAGKECKAGHWHYGSSSKPHKSKARAIKDAIAGWADFVDFEYGRAWTSFRLAADKRTSCDKHPGRQWTCNVEGRPCKRTR
jgi:hypothetical protein